MFKHIVTVFACLSIVSCDDARKHRHEDPFAILDKQISHTLAYHYLWPWSQLMQAAAALEAQEYLEEPKIISDDKKLEINVFVKRFQPDDLRVRVKNHYIIIEGRHKIEKEDQRFAANHFEQRYVLPRGSNPEEVSAIYKSNGVLTVSVPKHEQPPERLVPIEVIHASETTEKPTEATTLRKEDTTDGRGEVTEMKEEANETPSSLSTSSPVEHLELAEATTHVGKIRKKELKTTKKAKDNEVTKGGEGNGLDYTLLETEE